MEKSFNPITIALNEDGSPMIGPHLFKSETRDQVGLRQEVLKTYASGVSNNSKVTGLFEESEFGFEQGEPYVETRMTWIDIPKGTTVEQVKALLDKSPNARIYKELSSEPILSDQQKAAIEQGLTDLETIAERQLVVHGELDENGDENPLAGEPIMYNDKPQYKCLYFDKNGRDDIDTRVSEESAAEITADDIAQA